MKKKFLSIGFVLLIIMQNMTAAGLLVFDTIMNTNFVTEMVTSLTKLYEMYDQTMNQIEMIQQKYEQMQFYIDRAANWQWQNIQWDGDLDFRDEITQATKQVNRQLTNIRKIRNSLTSNTVSWGGQSFSLASLAGVEIEGQGNLKDFVKEGNDYYAEGFRKAAQYLAEGVPENEARYVWAKYGLSPANYNMVREVEKKVKEKAGTLIAYVEDSPEKKALATPPMDVIENIMKMLQQQGATPDQIASVQAMLQEQTIFSLKGIETKLEQAIGYIAWYNQLLAQKEESEKQSKIEKMQEEEKNTISSFF